MSPLLSDELQAWAENTVGPVTVEGETSHAHGESRVWKLRAERDGAYYYLKCHRQPGKWRGEINAYRAGWAASLGANLAPRLVTFRDANGDEPRAVLLSDLRGAPMDRLTLSPDKEQAAWMRAGEALRRLQDRKTNAWFGGCDENGAAESAKWEADPARFVLTGVDAYITRCERVGGLDVDLTAWARETLPVWSASLEGETPVPCHRDYTPRNWLADPQTGEWSGVIDFEHARWDVRARDLARPFDQYFSPRPDLQDAFFSGYGCGAPSERLLRQIQVLRLVGALGGYGWAIEHNDPPFAEQNRDALLRLRREAEE